MLAVYKTIYTRVGSIAVLGSISTITSALSYLTTDATMYESPGLIGIHVNLYLQPQSVPEGITLTGTRTSGSKSSKGHWHFSVRCVC